MITGTDFLVMHTKDFDTAVEFYGNARPAGVGALREDAGRRVQDRQPHDRGDAVGGVRDGVPDHHEPARATR